MKKTSVFPWSKAETDWLVQSIKDHPDWRNAVRYHHFRKAMPNQLHTRKATASKINTLRPNIGKSKWNPKAHETLAQLVSYEVPRSEMATYFGVTEPAIAHQIHKIKNLGLLKATPGRQIDAHERTTKPLPLCIRPTEQVKQLNIDFNQRDADTKASIAAHNKLSSSIRAIDLSVENLMSKPRTATEMRTTLAEAEQMWGGTTQELILNQVVQVVDHLAQIMNNTLQLIKEEKCNSIS